MVVFTCNHCGDSVNKPSVVKHYGTKCRGNSVFLTCMDCQKDFKNGEHDGHTKCISEAERYSGKDYVPKPGQNKGQKKQDNWIDAIRSLSTNKDKVDPKLRNVFSRLKSYENIPRKKAKFQNFVQNSFKIQMSVAMKVWDILEKELEELKIGNVANENKENETEKFDFDSRKESENKNNDIDLKQTLNETDSAEGKMKSKQKNSLINNFEEPYLDNGEPNKKKKKKNKKSNGLSTETQDEKLYPFEEENQTKIINPTLIESKTEVAEKDVSNKKKKRDNSIEVVDNKIDDGEKLLESGVNKKKSKKNKIISEDITENKIINISDEPVIKKKKKNGEDISNLGDLNIKFDWYKYINKCVVDGMIVSTLKDKVLKKFKKMNPDTEINNKIEKTFRKYLKKSGLIIEDDIVKIEN